jgi:hypothetical protein
MICHARWTPKRGHSDSEYEDAHAADTQTGRLAIADGAAESSFAALWARLLVDGFVEAPDHPSRSWAKELPRLRQTFTSRVANYRLPWFAQDKLAEGTHAAFLGVEVGCNGWFRGPRWEAVAVGDSCLFLVRGRTLVRVFPVGRSTAFTNHPDLISTLPTNRIILQRAHGSWREGDLFLLATDALAQWILRSVETGGEPWTALTRFLDESVAPLEFAAWTEELRAAREMHNDDVTLLAARL